MIGVRGDVPDPRRVAGLQSTLVLFMAGYYDDNFGHWNIESEEDIEFYHEIQRESVEKICQQCGETVRLHRRYVICNDCADRNESGFAF